MSCDWLRNISHVYRRPNLVDTSIWLVVPEELTAAAHCAGLPAPWRGTAPLLGELPFTPAIPNVAGVAGSPVDPVPSFGARPLGNRGHVNVETREAADWLPAGGMRPGSLPRMRILSADLLVAFWTARAHNGCY